MKIFNLLLFILVLISYSVAFKNDLCALEHSKNAGNGLSCRANIPSWSYNAATNNCVYFVYGGCNGNDNRFDSEQNCELWCKQ